MRTCCGTRRDMPWRRRAWTRAGCNSSATPASPTRCATPQCRLSRSRTFGARGRRNRPQLGADAQARHARTSGRSSAAREYRAGHAIARRDAILARGAGDHFHAPAYSGRPSFVSQSVISCIAAHARLNFGPVDPLDARFYPIDRAARNRPKRTSEGKCLRTQRPLAEIAGRAIQRRQTRTRRALPTRSACSSAIPLPASTAPADFRPNDPLRRNATALQPHVTMSHTPLHRHSSAGK
jgi:hypothetical protein